MDLELDFNLFNLILDCESSGDDLLSRSIQTDKTLERWAEGVKKKVHLLETVGRISSFLLSRYSDEFAKVKDKDEPEHLIRLLKSAIEGQYEIVNLLEGYSLVLDYFEEGEWFDISLITSKEELYDQLFDLFFEDRKFHVVLEDIGSDLNKLRKYLARIRVSQSMGKQISSDERLINNFEDGGYFLYTVIPQIQNIQNSWWTEDKLILYFLNDQAVSFLTLSDLEGEDSIFNLSPAVISKYERIEVIDRPLALAQKYFQFSSSMEDTANHLALQGFHGRASELYKEVKKTIEKSQLYLGPYPSNISMKIIDKKINKLYHEADLFHRMTESANLFSMFANSVEINQMEKAEIVLEKLNTLNLEEEFRIDLKYISTLPSIYKSIVSTSRLMRKLENSPAEIYAQVLQLFQDYLNRINTSIREVRDRIILQNQHKLLDDIEEVRELKETVFLLRKATSLLPEVIDSRSSMIEEITIFHHYVRSLELDLSSEAVLGENKLLSFMYKTRSFHWSDKALQLCRTTDIEGLPNIIAGIRMVQQVSANNLLIDMYRYIIQYILISDILPNFQLAMTQDISLVSNTSQGREILDKKLDDDAVFKNFLSEMIRIVLELLKMKTDHPGFEQVFNWAELDRIHALGEVILSFYSAMKSAISAGWDFQLGHHDSGSSHLEEARKHAFEAAKGLENSDLLGEQQIEIHGMIFGFGQYTYQIYNNPDKYEFELSHFQKLFEVLKGLVFGL